MSTSSWLSPLVFSMLSVGAAAAPGCMEADPAPEGADGPRDGTGGAEIDLVDAGRPSPGTQATVLAPDRECESDCDDLPPDPFIVEGAPADAPSQFPAFDEGRVGSGPCISDPPMGALFPYNWMRPRVKWAGTAGQLYEVRIHSSRQRNTFLAYTTRPEFFVPRAIWYGDSEVEGDQGLAMNSWGDEIVVEVRDTSGATSRTVFQTAPVPAGGSLVYWVTTRESMVNNDGWLMGFSVGDEASIPTLALQDVQMPTFDQGGNQEKQNQQERCIGCHTSTPDGNAVAYNDGWPWNGMISDITADQVGAVPDYVTPGGQVVLNMPWQGIMTFSRGHWEQGFKVVVTTTSQEGDLTWDSINPGNNNETTATQLIWIDLATPRPSATEAALLGTQTWELQQSVFPELDGVAFGVIARNGDSRAAIAPDWSHDGQSILYTSTSSAQDGRVGAMNDTDIYLVGYNNGSGGDARAVTAAAQAGVAEYYPDFSADDALVAFNRVEGVSGLTGDIYARTEGEIWIAPINDGAVTAAGGETAAGGAIRVRANDAHACSGERSPGMFNSWPKWSPVAHHVDETNTTYYWLIFSSGREARYEFDQDWQNPDKDRRYAQLYMAPITVTGGEVTTYPALYLWNQDQDTSNYTPAWDDFNIPEVPPPVEVW